METDPRKATLVGRAILLAAALAIALSAPSAVAASTGDFAKAGKLDDTPPTFFISSSSGYQTRNQQPVVYFYGSDVDGAESGTGIDRYEVRLDDGAVVATLPPASTEYQPSTPLPDGDHSVTIEAFDTAGNSSVDRSYFTVDTTPTPVADIGASTDISLTGLEVSFAAGGSRDTDVDGSIVRWEWDLDGNGTFETDTGTEDHASHIYNERGVFAVTVRVTNDSGFTATKSVLLDVRPQPPDGEFGVSINDGDVATNDPHVTLSLIWPKFSSTVIVSNDGGFGAAGSTASFDLQPQIPWKLRPAGAKRVPRVVYVRFKGSDFADDQPFTDDIILDKRKPVVDHATLDGSGQHASVALHASDDNSGVAVAEFYAKRRGKPIDTVRFTSRRHRGERVLNQNVTVSSRRAPRFVRVQDAAGNDSHLAQIHDKHRNL